MKSVFVTICGDMVREPTETFSLILTGPSVVNPDIAVMNIHDTANRFRGGGAICTTTGSIADPYPSTITVSGAPTQIGSMRVTLYDVTQDVPDNMDVLLVGPSGQKFVLMADAGGTTSLDTPVTLTFSDAAGQVLPNTDPLTTGEYEPTNWEPGVASFPAPAPPAPYNEPGSAVGGTGTQTLIGTFGGTDANGVWSLYVRDDTGVFSPTAISGCIGGGWGLEFLGPTAGNASVSGRVTTADGRGMRNAVLTLTGDSLRTPLVTRTRAFGYYSFDGLQAGETYIVTIDSRNYTFGTPSQVLNLTGSLTDVNFQAEPR